MFANIPAGMFRSFLEGYGYFSEGLYPSSFEWQEFIVNFLGVAILAPIIEEFVFRGVIMSRLAKHGNGFAVVVSGLIFGLAHSDVVSVVFATIVGLAFGWIYLKTGNLWVTIFVHFLNNALAVLQEYYEFFLSEGQVNLFSTISYYGPMILGLLALLVVLIGSRGRFFSLPKSPADQPSASVYDQGSGYWDPSLKLGEGFSALLRSPGIWLMVLSALLTTYLYSFPRL